MYLLELSERRQTLTKDRIQISGEKWEQIICIMQNKTFYSRHTLPFCGGQQMPAGIWADFVPRKENAMEFSDWYKEMWKIGGKPAYMKPAVYLLSERAA